MRDLPSSIIIQFDTKLFHDANRIVAPMTWPLDDLLHDFFTGMIGHDADDTLDNIADYVNAEEEVEEGTGIFEPILPVEIRDMIYVFLVEAMEKLYYFIPEAYAQQFHFVTMTGGDSVLLKRRAALDYSRGHAPELTVLNLRRSSDRELVVQPSFRHIQHLPILEPMLAIDEMSPTGFVEVLEIPVRRRKQRF